MARNVSPDLVEAVIEVESGGNPNAVNPRTGAAGLMQVMEATARDPGFGVAPLSDRFNPEENRRFGTEYLGAMIEATGGNTDHALMAYNWGLGNVRKWIDAGMPEDMVPEETRNYVKKINSILKKGGTVEFDIQLAFNPGSQGDVTLTGGEKEDTLTDGQTLLSTVPTQTKGARVNFDDLSAPTPYSTDELMEIEKKVKDSPGFLQGLQLATQSEWSLYWVYQNMGEAAPDPDFKLTDDFLKELTKDIPEEHWDYFEKAHSKEHALQLRELLKKDLHVQQELAKLGWTGVGLQVGAAILDPVAIAAVLATEGTLGPYLAAVKAGRIARALKMGAAAGVTDASIEALLVNQKPTGDPMDILYAGMASMALGGAIGAARRGLNADEEAALSGIATRAMRQIEERTAREGEAASPGSVSPEVTPPPEGSSAGAMQAPVSPVTSLSKSADETLDEFFDSPETAFSGARWDVVGRLKGSRHDIVRGLGAILGEDAVGNANHAVNQFAATERQALMQRRYETQWFTTAEPQFRSWAAEQGANPLTRNSLRRKFMEQVADAIEDDALPVAPQVRATAKVFQDIMEDYLVLAKNPSHYEGGISKGVKGFDRVEADRNYMTRIYDERKLGMLMEKVGRREVNRLFSEAIQRARPDLDPKLAEKLGQWHVGKLLNHSVGADLGMQRALAGEDQDLLREMLQDSGEFAPEEIDLMIRTLSKPRTGEHSRAKQRLLFDENYEAPLRDKYGTSMNVRIKDLLVRNAEDVFLFYNRQMSGSVAFARAGFSSQAEFDTIIKHIRQTAGQIDGYSEDALKADIARLEFLRSAITGRPYFTNAAGQDVRWTKWGRLAKMIGDYNFIRVMNQVGFAQISEIGNIVGQAGMKAALSGIPAFRALTRNMKTGKLEGQLEAEIEAIWGIGTDRLRGVVLNRWDEYGSAINPGEGGAMAKAEYLLHKGKRITSDISGMAGVNTVLHRWASKAIAQRMTDMAYNLSSMSRKRLASIGLSDEMMERISQQIKAHSKVEKGIITKAKLRQINLDDWDDLEARETFRMSVFRLGRRIIQENDPGNASVWMSHPVFNLITQFRTFMLGAWAKQTLAGIHMRDPAAVVSFFATMVAGGLAYTGQTYLNSLGRDDQADYLEDRLSPAKLGLAAFQRSAYSSIIPMIVETPWSLVSDDPLFDFRSTGLASDSIFGNPSFDLMNKAGATLSAIGKLIVRDDYELSQENLRNFFGTLPFENASGIRNLTNVIGQDLPRRSESSR